MENNCNSFLKFYKLIKWVTIRSPNPAAPGFGAGSPPPKKNGFESSIRFGKWPIRITIKMLNNSADDLK